MGFGESAKRDNLHRTDRDSAPASPKSSGFGNCLNLFRRETLISSQFPPFLVLASSPGSQMVEEMYLMGPTPLNFMFTIWQCSRTRL